MSEIANETSQNEAPAPSTVNPITFTPLDKNAPGAVVTRCQGWYPNKMQCTRSGDYQGSNGLQYCGAHAKHIEAGIHIAPVNSVRGTGTVQEMKVPEELFQVETPSGETITIEETKDNTNEQPATTNPVTS